MSRQLLVQQQGSWLVIDDNKIVHSPVRPRPDRAALVVADFDLGSCHEPRVRLMGTRRERSRHDIPHH